MWSEFLHYERFGDISRVIRVSIVYGTLVIDALLMIEIIRHF